jgi:hypothetical protein
MTTELKIVGQRGGNRHPVPQRNFILDYLSIVGEDYIASIHRAYKAALDQVAISRGRKHAYHKPNYHTFDGVINKMAREGLVEFSGREEESDNPMFADMEWKPLRRYYRIATGAPTTDGHMDGHKLALETHRHIDGTHGQINHVSPDGDSLGGNN